MRTWLWGLWGLALSIALYPADSDTVTSERKDSDQGVVPGQVFRATAEIDVPREAEPALRLHLQALSWSRPLPWPYHLEKGEILDGTMTLEGRLVDVGTFEIPLGVFRWNTIVAMLPRIRRTAVPFALPVLTASDLLLPFPQQAFLPSAQNARMETELLLDNQTRGLGFVDWQGSGRHALAILCLMLVCIPLVYQLWRWQRAQATPPDVQPLITPALAFEEVKRARQQGREAWSPLLYVLNLLALQQKGSLTSYELKTYFEARGKKELAQAALLIEQYGYTPSQEPWFDQALLMVENEIKLQAPSIRS